jgi:Fe-S-cluster containining protein
MSDSSPRAPVSLSASVSGVIPKPRPGPLEQALDQLWDQSAPRLSRPRYLWTYLKLRRNYHLRFLKRSDMKLEVPFGLLPDCPNCLNVCCAGPQSIVTLRLKDIAALVDSGLSEHIQKTEQKKLLVLPPSHAAQLAQKSIFHAFFPTLKRDPTGTCTLLGPRLTCTAYPSWPISCARYPYSLDSENHVIFLAKGCESHRQIGINDAPKAIQNLVQAAIDGYNERIKDIILLHVALGELEDLGFLKFLSVTDTFWEKHSIRHENS